MHVIETPSYIINLQDYISAGSVNHLTRTQGIATRVAAKIDELALKEETIIVKIPKETYSLNPSFLAVLFENVIHKIGSDNFRSKFEFQAEGKYRIEADLDEAIFRIEK